ncbi:MAG: beta strand repeat-containing protein [Bacteroidota bacterium]
MKKIYVFVIVLMFITSVVNAADRYSVATGNWNATTTWSASSGGASGASAPVAGDNVFIEGGFTVNITSTAACANLTVGTTTSGTLRFGDNTARTLTVSGNVSIASGSTIAINDFNDTHTFNIGGNLTNIGTFDMNGPTSNDLCNVVFNGAANQTLSGAGGTTDFNLITINNTGAANDNIVDISSTNFTVPAGFLTLTSGFFKLSGSFSITNTFFPAAPSIGAGDGFWLNNSNATVSAQGNSTTLTGTLRISAGTYNIGTGAGNSLTYASGSSFIMEGGTLNIAARFSGTSAVQTTTFNMSGGVLTAITVSTSNTLASFDISAAGSSFTMSGGTVVVEESNAGTGGDYRNLAGTVSITGGVLQFGNGSTGSGAVDDFDITLAGTHNMPALAIVDNATSVPTMTLASGAPISTRGDFTINTGTTFNANGQAISITGNFANSGTFTSGTQTTTFNGAAAQSIGGTTATTFSSLTINNTSGGVSLSQDASVTGTMTFTSGVFTSTSTNILTINDGAGVAGASNSSYLDGPMIKLGNDDFTFPIGDPAGSYHRLRLDNTGGANGDSYTAEYFRASAKGLGTVSSPLYAVSNCEYWTLAQNSGTSTPNLHVSWTANSPCGGNAYTTSLTGLTVARLNAGAWVLANGTDQAATGTVGTGGDGTVADNGISLFGTFALGNTAPNQNPLPVKIGNIKAYERGSGVQIDWTAFTEVNVDSYVIERSADGATFTAIGIVPALNAAGESRYGYFDAGPLNGISFYRLRNQDFDGKSGYSNVVRIDLNKGIIDLTVYPNPVRGGGYLSYGGYLAKGNYSARIFNATGQQVYIQKFSHSGGAINQTIQLPVSMRPGLHSLQLDNEGVKIAGKTFMVQ